MKRSHVVDWVWSGRSFFSRSSEKLLSSKKIQNALDENWILNKFLSRSLVAAAADAMPQHFMEHWRSRRSFAIDCFLCSRSMHDSLGMEEPESCGCDEEKIPSTIFLTDVFLWKRTNFQISNYSRIIDRILIMFWFLQFNFAALSLSPLALAPQINDSSCIISWIRKRRERKKVSRQQKFQQPVLRMIGARRCCV